MQTQVQHVNYRDLSFFSRIPIHFQKFVKNKFPELSERSIFSHAITYNILFFGVPWFLLYLYGFLETAQFEKNDTIVFAFTLTPAFFFVFGSIVIYIGESKYYLPFANNILDRCSRLGSDCSKFEAVVRNYRFSRYISVCLFIIFGTTVYYFAVDKVSDIHAVYEHNVVLWTTSILIVVFSIIVGTGVNGLVNLLRLYNSIRNARLGWNPFHKDGRGGFGELTSFAFILSVLSLGPTLMIPGAVEAALRVQTWVSYTIYLFVILYGILIVLVFIIPMNNLAESARKEKDRILEKLSDALGETADGGYLFRDMKALEFDEKFANTAMIFDVVNRTNVRAFAVPEIVRVIFAGILPIFVTVVQILLEYVFRLNII